MRDKELEGRLTGAGEFAAFHFFSLAKLHTNDSVSFNLSCGRIPMNKSVVDYRYRQFGRQGRFEEYPFLWPIIDRHDLVGHTTIISVLRSDAVPLSLALSHRIYLFATSFAKVVSGGGAILAAASFQLKEKPQRQVMWSHLVRGGRGCQVAGSSAKV